MLGFNSKVYVAQRTQVERRPGDLEIGGLSENMGPYGMSLFLGEFPCPDSPTAG